MTRLLLIVLTFALLNGLSPMSNHMTMQTMHIEKMITSRQSNMAGGNRAREKPTVPCGDEAAHFSTSCAFLVPQFAYIGLSGGNERVGYSTPLIQTIQIEILAPPPKS